MRSRALRILAVVFFISGLYDAFGGFYYSFLVGTGRSIGDPPTHVFYALFIASFLICFAYLQLACAFNIRRYLLAVGVVMVGRLLYVILLFTFLATVSGFPATFLPTAIIDSLWSVLYLVLAALSDDIRLRELFVPARAAA